MAAQHIEGTLAALQAKLRASLATTIATVNSDSPDDHAVETPASADIVIGVRADPVAWPWVALLPLASSPDADQGQRVLWRHRVRVVGWLTDQDEGALPLKLIRFQRAIRECLLKGRIPATAASTTAGYAIFHVADEYGPSFQSDNPDSNDFFQAASSIFEVSQQQDLS